MYWAFTEGATATALVVAGGASSMSALQAVSICAGFPYTFALCFMCTALYRAFLIDQNDPSIMGKRTFDTGLFDFCDMFSPPSAAETAPKVMERIMSLAIAIFVPGIGIMKAAGQVYDQTNAMIQAGVASFFFYSWFILMCMDAGAKNVGYYYGIAWTLLMFFFMWVTFLRIKVREFYNVSGGMAEDFFSCLMMYPFVVSQMELQVLSGRAVTCEKYYEGKFDNRS